MKGKKQLIKILHKFLQISKRASIKVIFININYMNEVPITNLLTKYLVSFKLE